jgi:hypothetical protein
VVGFDGDDVDGDEGKEAQPATQHWNDNTNMAASRAYVSCMPDLRSTPRESLFMVRSGLHLRNRRRCFIGIVTAREKGT